MGGKLTISDDAHKAVHVGTNYGGLRKFLTEQGVSELFQLVRDSEGKVSVQALENWQDSKFWDQFD